MVYSTSSLPGIVLRVAHNSTGRLGMNVYQYQQYYYNTLLQTLLPHSTPPVITVQVSTYSTPSVHVLAVLLPRTSSNIPVYWYSFVCSFLYSTLFFFYSHILGTLYMLTGFLYASITSTTNVVISLFIPLFVLSCIRLYSFFIFPYFRYIELLQLTGFSFTIWHQIPMCIRHFNVHLKTQLVPKDLFYYTVGLQQQFSDLVPVKMGDLRRTWYSTSTLQHTQLYRQDQGMNVYLYYQYYYRSNIPVQFFFCSFLYSTIFFFYSHIFQVYWTS